MKISFRRICQNWIKMTTFMQEIIDLSDVPRRTDVPVCTNMTRWMFIVFPTFICHWKEKISSTKSPICSSIENTKNLQKIALKQSSKTKANIFPPILYKPWPPTSHPDRLTERELEDVTSVFRAFESGVRSGTMHQDSLKEVGRCSPRLASGLPRQSWGGQSWHSLS